MILPSHCFGPYAYRRPRELTPRIERWMRDKGWIDHRKVQRVERLDQAHVALLARIRAIA